jgi:glycosyltransferase involved in cell wall biosynthesis
MLSREPDSVLASTKSLLRPRMIRGVVALTRWSRRLRGRPAPLPADPTVAIVGFHETASGLGVSARGMAEALRVRSSQSVSLSELSRTPRLPTSLCDVLTPRSPQACRTDLVFHVYNPDIFLAAVRRFGTGFLTSGLVNVAIPIWETQTLPPLWTEVLSLYDVIATHSRFSAEALERGTSRPVAVIPPCLPERPARVRRSDGPIEFLTMFDQASCFDRKNPLGAVRAFRQATAALPAGTARLRIKCHAGTPADVIDRLLAEAGGAAVETVARTLDEAGMEALWQECDCLLSLHRSEGYGLPVAEALSRGIPVIASRQGGVLDFADDSGCLLISGTPAVPPHGRGQYAEWSGWLEPDTNSAAAAIVAVTSNYHAAVSRAEAGRRTLQAATSPARFRAAFEAAVGANPMPGRIRRLSRQLP